MLVLFLVLFDRCRFLTVRVMTTARITSAATPPTMMPTNAPRDNPELAIPPGPAVEEAAADETVETF